MLTDYIFVTILFVSVTVLFMHMLKKEQESSRKDRERYINQNKVLEEQTFPALQAADHAVESAQNLIYIIQQSIVKNSVPKDPQDLS